MGNKGVSILSYCIRWYWSRRKELLKPTHSSSVGTSEKTVKVHRGRIMKKLRVQSIAEFVQVVMRARSAGSLARAQNYKGIAQPTNFPVRR